MSTETLKIPCPCQLVEEPPTESCTLVIHDGGPAIVSTCLSTGRTIVTPLSDDNANLLLTTSAKRAPEFLAWLDTREKART